MQTDEISIYLKLYITLVSPSLTKVLKYNTSLSQSYLMCMLFFISCAQTTLFLIPCSQTTLKHTFSYLVSPLLILVSLGFTSFHLVSPRFTSFHLISVSCFFSSRMLKAHSNTLFLIFSHLGLTLFHLGLTSFHLVSPRFTKVCLSTDLTNLVEFRAVIDTACVIYNLSSFLKVWLGFS